MAHRQTTKISITVSDELHAELKAYAKWKGELTVAGLLRLAVKHYLRQYPRYERKKKADKLFIEKAV